MDNRTMDSRFSMLSYFIERGIERAPLLSYRSGDVTDWQQNLREKVVELLGPFPDAVDLNPKTMWTIETDGLIKEKVIFQTEQHASVPAIIMKRADLDPTLKHRGLICLHGHGGRGGKDYVTGAAFTQDRKDSIHHYNYDYALQFARQGYITISPDLRDFGERHEKNLYPGRDSCNVHFIRGLLMGINLITLNIWDVRKTVDYLCQRADVDPQRIGCVGLSLGGTMTLHVSALELRIKAAIISCALTTYEEYAIKQGNFCGSQFIPGIYQYADLADMAGLIAPRPLLIESGVYDDGFPIDSAITAYRQLESIYKSAGADDRLAMDIFEGGHRYSGKKAFEFFDKWL